MLPQRKNIKASEQVKEIKNKILASLTSPEQEHKNLLTMLRNALPDNAFIAADMTQLAYSALHLLSVPQANCWFYPAGYGTLGFALPVAIGAKLAAPKRMGVVMVGDAGFQYTLQELGTAVEHELPLAIILWNNGGLGEIEYSMKQVGIKPVQVKPHNPDFQALAKAYGCDAVLVEGQESFEAAVKDSAGKNKPTVIEVRQSSSWLRAKI